MTQPQVFKWRRRAECRPVTSVRGTLRGRSGGLLPDQPEQKLTGSWVFVACASIRYGDGRRGSATDAPVVHGQCAVCNERAIPVDAGVACILLFHMEFSWCHPRAGRRDGGYDPPIWAKSPKSPTPRHPCPAATAPVSAGAAGISSFAPSGPMPSCVPASRRCFKWNVMTCIVELLGVLGICPTGGGGFPPPNGTPIPGEF